MIEPAPLDWGDTPRARQRRNNNSNYKYRLYKMGKNSCEACGWQPPVVLMKNRWCYRGLILELHHVVPVASGGVDEPDNLVLLCPNCHRIADILTERKRRDKRHAGPATKEELTGQLQLLSKDPEEWERRFWKRNGQDQAKVTQLLSDLL